MNLDALQNFCAENGCTCLIHEPMSAHTSFHIGGPCDAFITVETDAQLCALIAYLRASQHPFRVIGKGSNLLVPDDGYRGIVVTFSGTAAEDMTTDPEQGILCCGAGTTLKNACRAALRASLTGLEFAYGIPGSVGGAVFMNAGAYGGEISQVLVSVDYLDENAEIRTISAKDAQLSYRRSIFMDHPEWVILRAKFSLGHGDPAEIQSTMDALMGRRKSKQPLEFPSAGSTFKRPEGSYASMLIDQCGLKGLTVGGAQVSEKHAGFVINRGNATFADVTALCTKVREIVQAQTGFVLELEPEVLK